MKKGIILKIIVAVLVISGLTGSGYLFYNKLQLEEQIVNLQKEIEDGNRRERMLKRKYSQEKTKLATCMRAKLAEESKNAKLCKTVKTLTAEKETLAAQNAAMEKKYEAKIAVYGKKIQKLEEYKERMKAARETLVEKYRELAKQDREKAEQISELKFEKQELQSNLKMTESSLERSRKHNTQLCEIAEELTEKYLEKTGGSAEPFTKLGMVEMEHLVQEYLKRIDKEKIIEQ